MKENIQCIFIVRDDVKKALKWLENLDFTNLYIESGAIPEFLRSKERTAQRLYFRNKHKIDEGVNLPIKVKRIAFLWGIKGWPKNLDFSEAKYLELFHFTNTEFEK